MYKDTRLKKKDFFWSQSREPHLERRKSMLKKYPEIRKLFGIDRKLKYIVIALVALQLFIALNIYRFDTLLFIIIAYFIGATINQALFLAIHELSHDLAFKKSIYNKLLAMFANIPIVFPYAMSFQIYHLKHHWEQGKDGIDTDIPTRSEAKVFRGTFGKMLWAINQILFYAFRPILVHPIKIDKWQTLNIIFQLVAMVIFLPFAGVSGFVYLLLSNFISGSLHPLAGHFISEHYVFKEGQETYSYYGPLNKLTFNVGYHNEHHDFPNIPGSRLPELKKLAPEFYDRLYSHKSWIIVLLRFIFSPRISLFSRIKRA